MSRRNALPGYSPAVLEMLEATGELERIMDGRGLSFDDSPPPTPAPTPQPFVIEPPDWDRELAEARERERQEHQAERDKILREELARLERLEDTEAYPAPKRRNIRDLIGRETQP